MNISEIFYSILGESTEQGLPCAFIRVAGCNLRCSYCDTVYAQKGGKEYPVEKILSVISKYPTKLVEITGGEPLLQENIRKLIRELIKRKYKVLIETNGSLDIGRLPAKVIVIMDIKCPSSGMHDNMNWGNVKKLKSQDEIKFVLSDSKDYLWAKGVIKKYNLSDKNILLSPVFNKLSSKMLSEWLLKDGLNARLHLQLHKIIGIR
ncbi:MAG: radical SAM protein [Candidatus Omnitrophica bacterium]|nr:radical SAM protein [Candidatus Omnitrophota bacterium]MBU1047243.1 radical SAM protein [Candidatus Omnitrophota bacterium]MBU1889172.1 radical SAM protein [Candidatus Omnitrophota bacterium]